MSHKRETPRAQINVRLEPSDLAIIDKLRGETPRNAWVLMAIAAHFPPLSDDRVRDIIRGMAPQKVAARPSAPVSFGPRKAAPGSRLKKR